MGMRATTQGLFLRRQEPSLNYEVQGGSSPDVQNEADLLLRVGLCGDDEQAVQEVNGNSMWTVGEQKQERWLSDHSVWTKVVSCNTH
jgi:hypothetical protein